MMKKKWMICFLMALTTMFLLSCGVKEGNKGDNVQDDGGIENPNAPDDGNEGEGAENADENGGGNENGNGSESEGGREHETPSTPENPDEGEGNEKPEPETPVQTTYSITYQAAPQCGISDGLFQALKMVLGTYPDSYTVGIGVTVSELRSDVIDETYRYTFEGWYYDEECTQKCENGVIDKDKTGDIVLYAQISKSLRSEGGDGWVGG